MTMTTSEPREWGCWTRLPTVGDVRNRVRDRLGDVVGVVDDVIKVWRDGGCGCGGCVERQRVEALVVASLDEEGGEDGTLLDIRATDPSSSNDRGADFNEVFYADQLRDRCIEVVDGGRAIVVGGGARVDIMEDAGISKAEGKWSLRAQLRLALAHIDFLREVKTELEGGKARLEKALAELRERREKALRRIADVLLVIEEAALLRDEEEAEIDLGKMLGSVIAELREEEEEIAEKIRDALPVTKSARKSKSKKVSGPRHVRLSTRDEHLCPYCGKRFSLANSFAAHLSDHAGRRRRERLICHTCGRGFRDAAALASHRSAAHRAEKGGGLSVRLNS